MPETISGHRKGRLGTHLTFLLFRPSEAPVLGLRRGQQARAGPGTWRPRPPAQLGLGGAGVARALPPLCSCSSWSREHYLGPPAHSHPFRTLSPSLLLPPL